ncbi:unnamed protein product [Lactuca virosa]|uniref:Protein TIFY n=1 Tax=Lactuca virosa TaxID=75947 RepID=A0AAU9LQE6_9ASTR|nr:unnamed protein product [Lactuca virosa]
MERDFMGLNSKEEAIEAGDSRRTGNHSGVQVQQRSPVQLTIFYKGTVNVYDDMSPEKAQAIMLLAGNGVHVSQPMTTAPSSPVSINPSTGTSSRAAMDATKAMSSLRRVMQSAVPQMRGASLARFLEKRKERVMASAPYNLGKSTLPGSSSRMNKDDNK